MLAADPPQVQEAAGPSAQQQGLCSQVPGPGLPCQPPERTAHTYPRGFTHAPVGTSLEVEKTDIETAASVRAGVPEGFLRRAPPPGAAAAGLWARVSLSGYFSKYTSAETWAGPSGEAGSDGALSHNVARVGP